MNGQERAKRLFCVGAARRSGFILVMALVVMVLGVALSVGIFALAHSMHTTDIVNRRSYEDQIDVARHIELAKGFIVARNIELVSADKSVLHGRGGTSYDYFPVRSLNDLQVCTPNDVADVLSREIPLAAYLGKARKLRLRVYDANYRVEDVFFDPPADMPPSLRPAIQLASFDEGADAYENEGEGIDPTAPKPVSGDVVIADHFKHYGAYVIRAEVIREEQNVPLRRTEEAFFQLVRPAYTVTP